MLPKFVKVYPREYSALLAEVRALAKEVVHA